MYRQYENPYQLKKELEELENEFNIRLANGEELEDLIEMSISISELKDRVSFAWQDDEYNSYDDYLDMMPCDYTGICCGRTCKNYYKCQG